MTSSVLGVAAGLFLATGFVLSCYAVPRNMRKRPRDDPEHVYARLIAITVFTVLTGPLCVYLCWDKRANRGTTMWEAMGVTLPWDFATVSSTVGPLLQVMLLFMGPLLVTYVTAAEGVRLYDETLVTALKEQFKPPSMSTAVALRNFVVAPVLEEFAFRGCLIALLHSAGWSFSSIVWLSPVMFGVAHVHHAWSNIAGGMAVAEAATRSAFQFAYTWLFGVITAYTFARTGNLYGCIAQHVFCNLMGFPSFAWRNPQHPLAKHAWAWAFPVAFVLGIIVSVALRQELTPSSVNNPYV